MSSKTFDRKDITAIEARGLIAGVNWDDFVNNKIKECNEQIPSMLNMAIMKHVLIFGQKNNMCGIK